MKNMRFKCWAAIHSVCTLFSHDDCDAILLVDASNAFNSLNRIVALHNICQLCPPISTLLINTYHSSACLFISGDTLMSEEGTTTIPLLKQLPSDVKIAPAKHRCHHHLDSPPSLPQAQASSAYQICSFQDLASY